MLSTGRSLAGTSLAAQTLAFRRTCQNKGRIRQAKAVVTLVLFCPLLSMAPAFIRSLALVWRFVAARLRI
jgi:hypothetical protein